MNLEYSEYKVWVLCTQKCCLILLLVCLNWNRLTGHVLGSPSAARKNIFGITSLVMEASYEGGQGLEGAVAPYMDYLLGI
jgi:hypothetical protein